MRKIIITITALLLTVVMSVLSIITVIAATDPVQGASYSYTKSGRCSLDYGSEMYFSSNYIPTRRFYVNDNTAICSWAVKSAPNRGTYTATKYYLTNSDARSKAFYWLLINSSASIPSSAKYYSSSQTYAQDLAKATADADSSLTQTYAFVHSVIDYLQNGTTNPYADSTWNNVVRTFASKVRNYPDASEIYAFFYFFPDGSNTQSIMSIEEVKGWARIQKVSSDSTTKWYSGYILQGAVYGIYNNYTDMNNNNPVQTVTTDSNGYAYVLLQHNGESGHWWVAKEITPSKGYDLDPNSYKLIVEPGNYSQGRAYRIVSTEPAKQGSVQILKSSADPSLTENNSHYSLAGAVYGVYRSEEDAENDGYRFDTLTTDENGESNVSVSLYLGTYFIKEVTAPEGFELDETIYPMVLTKSETTVLEVTDFPSYIPHGNIRITKSSMLPDITDGNTCYSLEGAVYGIYSDSECQNKVAEVTTDTDGVGVSELLSVGDYYIKEITASEGYKLDITVYPKSVTDNEITDCQVTEIPYTQTVDVLLQKRNASEVVTDENMSGAKYTVNFYPDYLDSEEDVQAAMCSRSWIFQTDYNNTCKLDDDHLLSGDDLFQDGEGNYVLPLGTVTIQETDAPYGYYLDETLFIRKITLDGAAGVEQFNIPISDEFEIPEITISGTKTWDDDNDRDGKRPNSITVELYRDNELIDSISVSASTNWEYEFTGLKKAYADSSISDHVHQYEYDVREVNVDSYSGISAGISVDSEDENHYICDFTNRHTVERTSVSGTKSWSDYNDVMGYRPQTIKVNLYRNGTKIDQQIVSQNNNWSYTFTNLYKYYDHGKEYQYSVGEEPVHGYSVSVDGFNLTNAVKTGSVTLFKTDENDNPLSGVSFKLYTIDGTAVASSTDGHTYIFTSLTNSDEDAIYTTNDDGKVVINGLPYGQYYFIESQTLLGFIPYGNQIPFEIICSDEAALNVFANVENAKYVMPETGGVGLDGFYIASITLAGLAIALFCCFIIKKSTMKGIYHND